MKQYSIILLLLVIALGLLPFILLSTAAFPAIDDFPCSLAARDAGLITSIVTWYKIWTARYFSVFMAWLCPLVRGWDSFYQLTATFVLAGHTIATGGFLYMVRKWNPISPWLIWLFAFLFTLGYLSLAPSVSECLYYYNGLVCYQPASMFFLLVLGLLFRAWDSSSFWVSGPILEFGLAAGLVFCIIGSNESSMLAITLLVSGFWGFFIIKKKSLSICYSLLLLEVVLLDSLVVFSPATQLRMSASGSGTRYLPWVFLESIKYSSTFIINLLTNPFFYLVSVGFLILIPKHQSIKNLRMLLFWLVFIYFLSHIPSFLGEGMVQGRTANANAFLFFLVWLILLFELKQSLTIQEQNYKLILGGMATVFCISFLITPKFQNNIFDAYSDLFSGLAQNHRKEVLARFQYLKSTKSDSVKVSPYHYFPSSTFATDIEPNNGNTSYNAFYARYYGKKHIELITD